ncbi:putative major facilitator superfamily transporter [Microlunatus phosphovorus NM-1]|uniref:Putative major facilitator superfamily transporter n=1 Tax=Microlunatus phosphovorus (strain ATCC 700054 / DSM 10555 / JCM 9379 / NBRC 101784 / NCIMB 13414 / VKM Ac-1990 / NM-1) TaxID=1032480 RepID=F5XJS6_MICPN|nr:putative major facilitator superfamily transporter [Microlunatus phosphovorus NM-1]
MTPSNRGSGQVTAIPPAAPSPKRTFAGIFVTVWANFTAFGVAVPVIPTLVTQTIGGSATLVGAAFATAAVLALVFRPVAGRLAQRHGPRRVMMLGSLLAALAAAAYALPFGEAGLLSVRIAIGTAEALVMTAGAVWTVSLAPVSRRGRIIGIYGLSMWGGLAAGPILGELAYRLGSYSLVWATAAALSISASIVLAALPKGERSDSPVSARLLPPAAILPGLALAAGGFGYAAVTSFGALAMASRGIDGGSILLSLFSAAYVLVRLLAGGLSDRFGPVPLILAAATLEATGLTLIALAPNWGLAAAGAVIAGGGFTLLYPSLAIIAVATAPESERGATLGAVSSFFDLSIGVAGLAGGALAAVSYSAVFGLSAVLALTAIAAAIAALRRSRSRDDSRDRSLADRSQAAIRSGQGRSRERPRPAGPSRAACRCARGGYRPSARVIRVRHPRRSPRLRV